MAPKIDVDECSGCGICIEECSNSVLDLVDDIAAVVDEDKCDDCGTCAEECPVGCILVQES